MNREHYRLVHNAMAEVAMEAEAQYERAEDAYARGTISEPAYALARSAAHVIVCDSEMRRRLWIAERAESDSELWSSWLNAEEERHTRDMHAACALRHLLRWVNT